MFDIAYKDFDPEILSITEIVDNVGIDNFLRKQAQVSEIILCQLNSIDVVNKEILQEKCISCGGLLAQRVSL